MKKNIIECRDLTLAYDGETVIGELSFDVPKGEIMLVSGENGSGKSTLIKALLGLIKPISGDIKFKDCHRRGIGYLPQNVTVGTDFPASVREVVASGLVGKLRLGMFMPKESKKKIDEAMSLTGVEDIASKCFNELSGGQRQRVLLARALCASRELLILDEPTNALDPASAAEMYSIIAELRCRFGMTVIMVSHDLEASVGVADRVLHLCCDGAFCCPVAEYETMLRETHSANKGGTAHTHSCHKCEGHTHDHGESEAEA